MFIISTAAFLALLWAAFSTARHVRRARRRRSRTSPPSATAMTKASGATAAELETPQAEDDPRPAEEFAAEQPPPPIPPASQSVPRDWTQLRNGTTS